MEASENPYLPPKTIGSPQTSHQIALERLSIPAYGLLFASAVTYFAIGLGTLTCFILFQKERKPYAGSSLQICLQFSPLYLVMLGCSAAAAYAAFQMLRGRQIHVCFAGAILSMLPLFTPGFVLGIPFGIWAYLVLLRKDTRAAFEEVQ